MPDPKPELDVLLPVHNEAESIEATVREMYDEFSPLVRLRFIVCEDGSVDNTKDVLRRLSDSIPMRLILADRILDLKGMPAIGGVSPCQGPVRKQTPNV